MLKRREFIKLSSLCTAGLMLPLSIVDDVKADNIPDRSPRRRLPVMHYHGHRQSGCAFHPELVDIWAGGGAALPDGL